jgi:hypothetical protein
MVCCSVLEFSTYRLITVRASLLDGSILLTTKALFISAAVVAGSNYTVVLTSWHTYLYFLAISFFAIGLNIFGYRFLGKWNEGACA